MGLRTVSVELRSCAVLSLYVIHTGTFGIALIQSKRNECISAPALEHPG